MGYCKSTPIVILRKSKLKFIDQLLHEYKNI
jgi:hypothetical protein